VLVGRTADAFAPVQLRKAALGFASRVGDPFLICLVARLQGLHPG